MLARHSPHSFSGRVGTAQRARSPKGAGPAQHGPMPSSNHGQAVQDTWIKEIMN
uniref:Uncharacterized protein n=1 Tax=Arundo donax TaxID=35708 RepID=A0A0A9HY92_ARUDO